MPQLLNPPESSLSRAHKRVTKQLLKQYSGEGMSADTATGAADIQEVIDVLDEAINLSEVLLNDADDTAFKNLSASTANRSNSIPTSSFGHFKACKVGTSTLRFVRREKHQCCCKQQH